MTDLGAYETITAQFDFRTTPGPAPYADGFSMMLIPTSVYGASGAVLTLNPTAEEPNAAGVFGLAFDLHPNLNNVSAHWNGFQVNELAVPTTGGVGVDFRNNGVFNRAVAQIQRVGNGSNLTVTLTADIFGTPGAPYTAFAIALPNMLPYENRVHFAGRTGGANMNADLDNINVAYSNPFFGGLAAAPTGHLYQDFDSLGTTGYRAVQAAQRTDTVFRPGPRLFAADAGSNGTFMRIVNDTVEGQNNRIAFDRAFDGGASNLPEVLEFDVRFSSTDGPADGLGVIFLPTLTQATAGDGPGFSEEANLAGALGIGFDIFSNGASDPAPAISIHWNNAEVADIPITDVAFGLNQFHRVQIIREPVPGGVNVTINGRADINGAAGPLVTLVPSTFVAGAFMYDYRVAFSGRTGGLNASHDIDTITSSQLAKAAGPTTETNFTLNDGAGWKAYRHNQGDPAQLRNDAGPEGDYLRLIHQQNDQVNSLVFDQQADGIVGSATGITAEFDARIINGPADAADGFSMLLLPVGIYGTTGVGALAAPGGVATFLAEEPNLAGVFALAFDLYNGGGVDFNEASLHWNGSVISALNISTALINLDAGVFHHVHLDLTESGADTLASLTLTPDIYGVPGTPVAVFSDVVIPGMSLYDYRVEFAARTGGQNMSVDLDNIAVTTVPEPGSAVLLALGLGALLRRKRK